ncbi:MAG: endo alpha-1,4 polygalactosaminidase [Bacteroidia bacterium]|jgi:cysteinyl-tRNA synthetase|nr:endo alpha-1,4 polygalactosaminidase [Bacteroidia bacterium]
MNAKYFFPLFFAASAFGLNGCQDSINAGVDYRAEMRTFVQKINARAELMRPGFLVVPQNGEALLTIDGKPGGTQATDFINAIDGFGREELFYGYNNQDDLLTPESEERTNWQQMCVLGNSLGKKILVTDYCQTTSKADDSYTRNNALGFISTAADSRELDKIPAYPALPYNVNTANTGGLNGSNFLYLIAPDKFETKEAYLQALEQSRFDIFILDLFWDEPTPLTPADLARLRNKPGGGTRTLLCYMSIGQAESYRYYWNNGWNAQPPSFIDIEDPSWLDNYYVRYWDQNWQEIICGTTNSYLRRVVDAGFDGVYLDLVNAYEFYEQR